MFFTLKRFREIDTYPDLAFSQDGTSEEFIGEWAEKRGIRDQLVIATKVRARSVAAFASPIMLIPIHTLSTR